MEKIKVGIVNYLNTAPLLYGIENSPLAAEIELVKDYPSGLARSLKAGTIDVGLVPVAVLPSMDNWHLSGDYCIGSDGAVASVCLFSEVDISQVKTVLLDYQSRTSVELARILLRDYWKTPVTFVQAGDGFEQKISGSTAAVIIGDRALVQRKISPFVYDLGAAWKNYTGLPFVFAAWVSNKPLSPDFIQRFNEANASGLSQIDKVIENCDSDLFDLSEYFKNYISYSLDDRKKKGMDLFLKYLQAVPDTRS